MHLNSPATASRGVAGGKKLIAGGLIQEVLPRLVYIDPRLKERRFNAIEKLLLGRSTVVAPGNQTR